MKGGTLMREILLDAFFDTITMLPFLYLTYLLMEYIEHKSTSHMKYLLVKARSFGPIIGAILGIIPQCGFSVIASGLYVNKTITLGTLISVFVATSDEAIPILLSQPNQGKTLFSIVVIKLIIAALSGFLLDMILKKMHNENSSPLHNIHEHCEEESKTHSSIFSLAFIHAFKVFCFIFIVNLILTLLISYTGESTISKFLASGSFLQPLLAAFVGFIPNCVASVILSQLYVDGIITFGSLTAGLITGAGLGLLTLVRMYDNRKDLVRIFVILFIIGVISGMTLDIVL